MTGPPIGGQGPGADGGLREVRHMEIRCCDCKRLIALKEPYEDDTVTHGYCEECADKALKQLDDMTGGKDELGTAA
jgi:hypothetical protein